MTPVWGAVLPRARDVGSGSESEAQDDTVWGRGSSERRECGSGFWVGGQGGPWGGGGFLVGPSPFRRRGNLGRGPSGCAPLPPPPFQPRPPPPACRPT